MKASCLIGFGILLVTTPLFARDKVDVLVMKNGDRFTCEIKGLDAGVLYVGLDYAQGTVQVDWSKVSQVESKQLFLVTTQDGRKYMGALSMVEIETSDLLRIEPAGDTGSPAEIKQGEVVGINQTSENLWQRFNGAINSGFTYSKANDTTQYSLGANADYVREKWSFGADFNSALSSSSGSPTSTRNNVMAYYHHLMRWDNWFYTDTVSFLQSTEQQILLQSNIGTGIGRYVKNTNRSTINIFSGLAYQNTKYSEADSRPGIQNMVAAMVGVEAGLFKFDKTKLTLTSTAFPALNQPGRIFNNVSSTYYLKFWGNFTWNLSFYGNWDNQPPAHFSGSDYGISSGLGWTFGNYNSYMK